MIQFPKKNLEYPAIGHLHYVLLRPSAAPCLMTKQDAIEELDATATVVNSTVMLRTDNNEMEGFD